MKYYISFIYILLFFSFCIYGSNFNIHQSLIETFCAAAYVGHLPTINHMLSLNINPDEKDEKGASPLYYAVKGEQMGIIKYLMLHGTNITLRDTLGNTILHYAVAYCSYNFIREIFILFKEKNLNIKNIINIQNQKGFTPLHIATVSSYTDQQNYILSPDQEHQIILSGRQAIIGLLILLGQANTTIRNNDQKTAQELASPEERKWFEKCKEQQPYFAYLLNQKQRMEEIFIRSIFT